MTTEARRRQGCGSMHRRRRRADSAAQKPPTHDHGVGGRATADGVHRTRECTAHVHARVHPTYTHMCVQDTEPSELTKEAVATNASEKERKAGEANANLVPSYAGG